MLNGVFIARKLKFDKALLVFRTILLVKIVEI